MSNPSRRQFLGITGSTLLALLGSQSALYAASRKQTVHLHSFDPAETETADAVAAAMRAASDLSWLRPGDSVFVKIASNSDYGPPAVTSPAALAGVVRTLKEAGAGTVYVGDMSGAQYVRHLAGETIGSTRANMQKNGLLAAAEAAGAAIHCFEEVPFANAYLTATPPGDHHWGSELQVAEILDRVDHVVNLPRLGKHVLAGASLGLKNAVGWISDHSRMVLHRDAATFQEKIAEINAIPQLAGKLRLTLTLADRALTTYGPDAGYALPLAHPLIVASDDIVSHDQIALLALMWARAQTPRSEIDADPYPAQSDGFNWYFVRVTWDNEIAGYQSLPTFGNLAAADALTHINYAYACLQGGRPDLLEVITGGAVDESLIALLTRDPDLNIAVRSAS